MTEVAFHFNAPDKVQYACRLLRKAYIKGTPSIFVLAPPQQIGNLDMALWTMAPNAFVPHCKSTDPEPVKARTPIHIGAVLPPEPRATVLVNLQEGWVSEWGVFEKVVEVVALDEPDRQAARERWRRYKSEGVEPVRHDLRPRPSD